MAHIENGVVDKWVSLREIIERGKAEAIARGFTQILPVFKFVLTSMDDLDGLERLANEARALTATCGEDVAVAWLEGQIARKDGDA